MKKLSAIALAICLISGLCYVAFGNVGGGVALPISAAVAAETITVSPAFSDNMVLQRGKRVKIFGTGGAAGAEISVAFGGQVKRGTVASSGWAVYLDAMAANVSGDLSVTCGAQSFTYHDVIVGEVWLASGQSNMEVSVRHVKNKDATNEVTYAQFGNWNKIRGLYVPRCRAFTPQSGFATPATWSRFTGLTSALDYSAYAMAFASNLQKMLGDGIVIGIIQSAVSSSAIEEWLAEESFDRVNDHTDKIGGAVASGYYNGMIHNIVGYTIGGVIWYQGEANVRQSVAADYLSQFGEYASSYRAFFEDENLPFIAQQLVRFATSEDPELTWMTMRDVQWQTMLAYE
ncbi:MAG: sialate O-acetylesterase, partial [Clostridiales bacterium]|nr:sialate O-acetylesterase [Clostridiales bacterium]